jgi:hypothetical protein
LFERSQQNASALGGSTGGSWPSDMWSFLNTNAAGIQALAAVATVALTIVLVKVTAHYVRLTSQLADAAAAEVTHRRGVELGRLHELEGMLKLAGMILSTYPDSSEGVDGAMRRTISWDGFSFDRFQQLSTQLGSVPGQHAAIAVGAMTYLRDRAREVQQSNERHGFNWTVFPWPTYREKLDQARSRVSDIRDALRKRIDSIDATA